jgi:hypothetical protein
MNIANLKRFIAGVLLALPAAVLSPSLYADAVNNKINYIVDGKVVAGWTAITGDPEKWWSPLTELKGQSGSGKLVLEPAQFKTPGDAFRLTWAARKELHAQFSLGGNPIDLKALENAGALVIAMRVLSSPDKAVNIAMRCGDKCEGKIDISKNLKKLKKEEWILLPIALNCFSMVGADLSKIATPFEISTDGKLSIEISSIRLERLGPDEKGCVAEK